MIFESFDEVDKNGKSQLSRARELLLFVITKGILVLSILKEVSSTRISPMGYFLTLASLMGYFLLKHLKLLKAYI